MKIIFLSLSLFVSLSATAQTPFKTIVSSSDISSEHLGLYITKENKTVFENRSTQKFIPASLSKLLTAIAVLKTFNPDDRMQTELTSKAQVLDQRLDGELCIKGSGDPSFISEQLWVLVNNFTRTGVKKISGPLVVDSSYFDKNYFDDSRESVRVDRAYDSPVSGIPLNWNTVNVYMRPHDGIIEIITDPENSYFEVVNRLKSTSGKKVDVTIKKEKSKDGEKLIVSGTVGRENEEVVKYASVTYPDLWVGKNLLTFLKHRGIIVDDAKIESRDCGDAYKTVATSKGWTYFSILDGMLKFSNNFLAESLTKDLSVAQGHKPGSIAQGIDGIRDLLEKEYQLPKKDYDFVSPSGFTEKNRVAPKALGDLLWKAYKDFNISSYLLSAMASPQTEGTLSKRMKSLKEPRMIRAKTGLLAGAVGLAGFASDSKGEVYSFVFIYNGSGKEDRARDLFDRLATAITQL